MDGHIGPDKEANPAIYLVIFSSRVAKIGEFGCMEELRTARCIAPLPAARSRQVKREEGFILIRLLLV